MLKINIIAALLLIGYSHVAVALDKTFIWVEAEDCTSKTKNVLFVDKNRDPHNPMKARPLFNKTGQDFLQRSGWDESYNQQISGKGFLRIGSGINKAVSHQDKIQFDVDVPRSDDYALWVRINIPPPCASFLNAWFDQPEPEGEQVCKLPTSFWDVWSWWPWGGNSLGIGQKKIRLHAGKHTLYLGYMNNDFKVDKLLLTNDPNYVPYGPSQKFYTCTFEPIHINDMHPDYSVRKTQDQTPGWAPHPTSSWQVREDCMMVNHYYFVSSDFRKNVSPNNYPTYSIMDSFQCEAFSLKTDIINSSSTLHPMSDIIVLSGYRDEKNYTSLHLSEGEVELYELYDGVRKNIKDVKSPRLHMANVTHLELTRGRSRISVKVDKMDVLNTSMYLPISGFVGIGSFTGNIGFDNVVITPLDSCEADFNFSSSEDLALADWRIISDSGERQWNPDSTLNQNDILMYRGNIRPNCELQLDLNSDYKTPYALLFPVQNLSHYLELAVNTQAWNEVKIIRHEGTRSVCITTASLPSMAQHLQVNFQFSKGWLRILWNGKIICELPTSHLASGRFGVKVYQQAKPLPVSKLAIRDQHTIIDNFLYINSGMVSDEWKINSGKWKVANYLSESQGMDGQLIAQGSGVIQLGEVCWKDYSYQIEADFSATSLFSLLGKIERDRYIELAFSDHDVQLRRVYKHNPVPLATHNFPSHLTGWHTAGISFKGDQIVVTLDGADLMKTIINTGMGCVGIQNYGDFAVFDNFLLQVILSQQSDPIIVKNVDPMLVDIEKSIIGNQ